MSKEPEATNFWSVETQQTLQRLLWWSDTEPAPAPSWSCDCTRDISAAPLGVPWWADVPVLAKSSAPPLPLPPLLLWRAAGAVVWPEASHILTVRSAEHENT